MSVTIQEQLLQTILNINEGRGACRDFENSAPPQQVPVGRREGDTGLWQGEQRIVSATITSQECQNVVLEITYLAAGFILGCGGETMKQIWNKTGASICSKAGSCREEKNLCTTRIFSISGSHTQILKTVQIFVEAVERYKHFVDGKMADEVVDSQQDVQGIVFQYCPPPIVAKPLSARTMQFPKKHSDYPSARRDYDTQESSPQEHQMEFQSIESSSPRSPTNRPILPQVTCYQQPTSTPRIHQYPSPPPPTPHFYSPIPLEASKFQCQAYRGVPYQSPMYITPQEHNYGVYPSCNNTPPNLNLGPPQDFMNQGEVQCQVLPSCASGIPCSISPGHVYNPILPPCAYNMHSKYCHGQNFSASLPQYYQVVVPAQVLPYHQQNQYVNVPCMYQAAEQVDNPLNTTNRMYGEFQGYGEGQRSGSMSARSSFDYTPFNYFSDYSF